MDRSEQKNRRIWRQAGWDLTDPETGDWMLAYNEAVSATNMGEDADSQSWLAQQAWNHRHAGYSAEQAATSWRHEGDDGARSAATAASDACAYASAGLAVNEVRHLAAALRAIGMTAEDFVAEQLPAWRATGLPWYQVALAIRGGVQPQDAPAETDTAAWDSIATLAALRISMGPQ